MINILTPQPSTTLSSPKIDVDRTDSGSKDETEVESNNHILSSMEKFIVEAESSVVAQFDQKRRSIPTNKTKLNNTEDLNALDGKNVGNTNFVPPQRINSQMMNFGTFPPLLSPITSWYAPAKRTIKYLRSDHSRNPRFDIRSDNTYINSLMDPYKTPLRRDTPVGMHGTVLNSSSSLVKICFEAFQKEASFHRMPDWKLFCEVGPKAVDLKASDPLIGHLLAYLMLVYLVADHEEGCNSLLGSIEANLSNSFFLKAVYKLRCTLETHDMLRVFKILTILEESIDMYFEVTTQLIEAFRNILRLQTFAKTLTRDAENMQKTSTVHYLSTVLGFGTRQLDFVQWASYHLGRQNLFQTAVCTVVTNTQELRMLIESQMNLYRKNFRCSCGF
ncbi:hypothetical protein BKA69DRAFT_1167079 [Paraphysoderma sedebokerense]|nr:hypothetical protein BKA69DRAFT_1167079 [Paraphysoderma sedebokerense]